MSKKIAQLDTTAQDFKVNASKILALQSTPFPTASPVCCLDVVQTKKISKEPMTALQNTCLSLYLMALIVLNLSKVLYNTCWSQDRLISTKKIRSVQFSLVKDVFLTFETQLPTPAAFKGKATNEI